MAELSESRRRGTLTVVGLTTALMVIMACGIGSQPGDGPKPSARPSGTASPTQPDDGSMTTEEFKNDAQGAVRIAERYWGRQFASMGKTFQPVRRVTTYQRDGEISCGSHRVPRNNAVYCPAGDFIAYDVNWAIGAFRQVGDAFLFYLLGHEYAHGIQVRLGIQYKYTIDQELQADCLAGAMIGDSIRAKELTLEDGDLAELRKGLLEVADNPGQPWFAEGSHGSAEQRTTAFFAGYRRSLESCNLG